MSTKKSPTSRGYVSLLVNRKTYDDLLEASKVYDTPMGKRVASLVAELTELRERPPGLDADYVLSVLKACGATPEFIAKVAKRL